MAKPLEAGPSSPAVGVKQIDAVLLEALPDGVVVCDPAGTIVMVNELLLRMSGYRRDELMGEKVDLLVPDGLRGGHVEQRTRYVAQAPTRRSMGGHLDIRFRRRDGEVFPADIALSPLMTAAGLVVMAAVRDISEREAAEQTLRESEQRVKLVEDRERIARELHDGAIQALFAVGMGLQAAAMMSSDADLRDRLDGSVEQIDGVIRDLRNYIFGLRPGILADRELDQALRELVADFEARSGVALAVDIDAAVAAELSAKSSDTIQLAREALSNIAQHAGASTARLTLRREAKWAVLEIDDDGGGFDRTKSAGRGQGIRNMHERAAAALSEIVVRSVIGEGTTVTVRIPL